MKKYVTLGEVCKLNMGQSPDSSTYNDNGEGIPFYQGNADFGEIHPITAHWCTSPTKLAEDGDILISVRAPIGALNIATEKCCIGRGLAAITVDSENVIRDYIWYMLKSRVTMLQAMGTGSTFKAINKNVLNDMQFLMPTLEEQNQIALNLIKIDTVIHICTDLMNKLDMIVKSRFIEMFGNPISNSHNLPLKTLPELGELGRGVSKHRPRNAPELLGGKYPLIQTGDVANANLYIYVYNATYSEIGFKQSKMWNKGTLCITIAANIAKTAILTFDSCFPDSVVGFNANDKTNNIFIHYWFSFFQAILEEQAPESAQKNINLKILSELKVIVPPIALQEQFAAFVEQTDKSKFIVDNIKKIIRRVRIYDQL